MGVCCSIHVFYIFVNMFEMIEFFNEFFTPQRKQIYRKLRKAIYLSRAYIARFLLLRRNQITNGVGNK